MNDAGSGKGDSVPDSPDDSSTGSNPENDGARDLRGENPESGQPGEKDPDSGNQTPSSPENGGHGDPRDGMPEKGQEGKGNLDRPEGGTNTSSPEINGGRDLRDTDPERVPPGVTPPDSILPPLGPDLSDLGAPEYMPFEHTYEGMYQEH